jgi:erythromycin esterase
MYRLAAIQKNNQLMKPTLLTIVLIIFSGSIFSQTGLIINKKWTKEINQAETHSYKIKTKKGDLYKLLVLQNGIDLAIEVKGGKNSAIQSFDSPNGITGPEPVEFVADISGNMLVVIKPLTDSHNAKKGEYSIEYTEHVNAAGYTKILNRKEAQEKEFADWIRNNSISLKSVQAGSGFEDLNLLKPVLANKRVIGIGEATHGTKEFFQMKHRMLEFLVKEMGFTVFAIEASYSRCKYINDYVLNGKGDLDTATVIQGFTTWSTEEVREMIKWMRDYNRTDPVHKIQFVGFDLQVNDATAFAISNYYQRVDPSKKDTIDGLLRKILLEEKKGGIFSGDTTIRELISPVESLLKNFIENQGAFILKSSEQEFNEIRWCHKILHQYLISYSYNNFNATVKKEGRDFYMAQNILAWLNYFPKGTKMMVWAHNWHIAKEYLDGVSVPSMGSYLKKELKDEYYAIGFDFYYGKFQSNDPDLKNSPGWEEQEVGNAPTGNLSSYFVQAGLGNSFLDLTLTQKNMNIENWLTKKEIGTYSMGSQFSKKWPASNYIVPMKLSDAFDGVIFIKQSNRAVPVKRMTINNYNF